MRTNFLWMALLSGLFACGGGDKADGEACTGDDECESAFCKAQPDGSRACSTPVAGQTGTGSTTTSAAAGGW